MFAGGFDLAGAVAVTSSTDEIAILVREVLGDDVYESFARRGEHMTNSAMVAYALDQIDRARTVV